MLHQEFPPEKLRTLLVPRQNWRPAPTAQDRVAWNAIPLKVRRPALEHGEAYLKHPWPALPATLALDFTRTGNRDHFQGPYFARRTALCGLAVAECIEGQGRFIDDIVNGVWTICEESSWVLPAHLYMQHAGVGLPDVMEPVVDLFSGETASLLAWIHYLLKPQLDAVSPLLARRIEREVCFRVLDPNRLRDDFWWMGLNAARKVNNWNPWCNSNWLACTLLLENDETRRLAAVEKICRSLDRFIDDYPADGGCDEGPSYWGRAGASLFDCLELLHSASDGKIDLYGRPRIANIGRFIFRAHIAGRYFINFADAPAQMSPEAALVWRFGKRIGDKEMMALGAWSAQQHGASWGRFGSIGRTLAGLFVMDDLLKSDAAAPLPRDVWLADIQVMSARNRGGSQEGLYVAAKGGHNAESHNHNDVGQFIVYADGRPLLVDAGVEAYTQKTFSPHRYEIWTMRSCYHNLPTLGGVEQRNGPTFAARDVAYRADDNAAELMLDIAGAYPPEANLERWTRTVRLERGRQVVVRDAYGLQADIAEITWSLLTPCRVRLIQNGRLELDEIKLDDERRTGRASVAIESLDGSVGPQGVTIIAEDITLTDSNMRAIWGNCLTRVLITWAHPPRQGGLTLRLTP